MNSIWRGATTFALLASAACASENIDDDAAISGNVAAPASTIAGQPPRTPGISGEAANAADSASAAGTSAAGSILAGSRPAAGSTVDGSVNELVLRFSPPARLAEVTVSGPEGLMPMMVTAVGEVEHYSLPLSASIPGAYTVAWRASAKGREYQDSFGFTVR